MKTNLFSMLLGVLSFMFCSCHAQVGKNSSSAEDNHSYVDLGLPSGTLWATCNIGANSPEEYGDYFAWGETKGQGFVGGTGNYRWTSNSELTKYCTDSSYGYNGFTDDKTELDLEDDAAYVNWGPSWRMPSVEQMVELIDDAYTNYEWTSLNGVEGYKITSKANGNSIFLPATGNSSCGVPVGSDGNYWSRTLYSDNPTDAMNLFFQSHRGIYPDDNNSRTAILSVRPVRLSE